jgi:hypothetical protein
VSDTADAVSLSSSTRQQQLSSINNLLRKSDIESLGNEAWSKEIASGDGQAGIRTLDVYDSSFTHVPLAHPSYGIPSYTKKQLNLENEDGLTLTEQYYKYAGEDLVEIAQAN